MICRYGLGCSNLGDQLVKIRGSFAFMDIVVDPIFPSREQPETPLTYLNEAVYYEWVILSHLHDISDIYSC